MSASLSQVVSISQTILESSKAQELFKSDEYKKFVATHVGTDVQASENPAEFKAVAAFEMHQSLLKQPPSQLLARLSRAVGAVNMLGDKTPLHIAESSLLEDAPRFLRRTVFGLGVGLHALHLCCEDRKADKPTVPAKLISFIGNAMWKIPILPQTKEDPGWDVGYLRLSTRPAQTAAPLRVSFGCWWPWTLHLDAAQLTCFTVGDLRHRLVERLAGQMSILGRFALFSINPANPETQDACISLTPIKPHHKLIYLKEKLAIVPLIKSKSDLGPFAPKKLLRLKLAPVSQPKQKSTGFTSMQPTHTQQPEESFYFYADVECTLREVLAAVEHMAKIYLEIKKLRTDEFKLHTSEDLNRKVSSFSCASQFLDLTCLSAKIKFGSLQDPVESANQVQQPAAFGLFSGSGAAKSETSQVFSPGLFSGMDAAPTNGSTVFRGVGGLFGAPLPTSYTFPDVSVGVRSAPTGLFGSSQPNTQQASSKPAGASRTCKLAAGQTSDAAVVSTLTRGLDLRAHPLSDCSPDPAAILPPSADHDCQPPSLLLVEHIAADKQQTECLLRRMLEEEVPVHSSAPEVAQGKYYLHAILLKDQDVVETVILRDGFKTIKEPEKNYKYWSNREGEKEAPLTNAISKAFALVYELRTSNGED